MERVRMWWGHQRGFGVAGIDGEVVAAKKKSNILSK